MFSVINLSLIRKGHFIPATQNPLHLQQATASGDAPIWNFLWSRNNPHLFTLKFICFVASVIKTFFNGTASLSLPHLIGSRLVTSFGENTLLIKRVVFGLIILFCFYYPIHLGENIMMVWSG